MAEMPTCKKCARPHWRFTPCDRVPEPPPAPRPVRRELSVPDGYVRIGPNKFARADTAAQIRKPTYVQVAPGKYRKAT